MAKPPNSYAEVRQKASSQLLQAVEGYKHLGRTNDEIAELARGMAEFFDRLRQMETDDVPPRPQTVVE